MPARSQALSKVQALGGQVVLELPPQANAVAVELKGNPNPAAAARELGVAPGVSYVEQDHPRYPMQTCASSNDLSVAEVVPYGIKAVGVRDAAGALRDEFKSVAAGAKICIIDSGFMTSHPDLAGLSVAGYNSGWNSDSCGHGSHVAGTIAATPSNGKGVVGIVPPGTQLYIVKVFDGSGCGWSYSSDLVNAAYACKNSGNAKIISMSLGGSYASTTERNAFTDLLNQGVLSIAAAGNGGNNRLSYPASYTSVVSVAAIDENKNVASFSQYNSEVDISGPGVQVLSTTLDALMAITTIAGSSLNTQTVEFSGTTTVTNKNLADCGKGLSTDTCNASGKICIISRGDISFCEKAQKCQNSGGLAAIIYNNVATWPESWTLQSTCGTTIPVVGVPQCSYADIIQPALASGLGTVATSGTTPYQSWDGTSMATPHVSGVASLLWGANPTATAAQIRTSMEQTAQDLGTAGRDNYYGNGLVRADLANAYLKNLLGGGTSGGSTASPPPAGGSTASPPPPPVGGTTCRTSKQTCSVTADCCSPLTCNNRSKTCK